MLKPKKKSLKKVHLQTWSKSKNFLLNDNLGVPRGGDGVKHVEVKCKHDSTWVGTCVKGSKSLHHSSFSLAQKSNFNDTFDNYQFTSIGLLIILKIFSQKDKVYNGKVSKE
jgi:hypothetical protein